jgi:hypothetical protein
MLKEDGTGFTFAWVPEHNLGPIKVLRVDYFWLQDGPEGAALLRAAKLVLLEENPAYERAMWGGRRAYYIEQVRLAQKDLMKFALVNSEKQYAEWVSSAVWGEVDLMDNGGE